MWRARARWSRSSMRCRSAAAIAAVWEYSLQTREFPCHVFRGPVRRIVGRNDFLHPRIRGFVDRVKHIGGIGRRIVGHLRQPRATTVTHGYFHLHREADLQWMLRYLMRVER